MFELFKIGFIAVTFLDLVDIFIVAVITFYIIKLLKGTVASQIFYGLIAIILLSVIAQAINLKALSMILKAVGEIWLLAFIILFQPEIRRFLASFISNPIFRMFMKHKGNPGLVEVLTNATLALSAAGHGALIIVERNYDLRQLIESGTSVDAKVTSMMLRSIFVPGSPLHDGAVVIRDDRIVAARCSIPFSKEEHFNTEETGMRHRAAMTHSSEYDSIVIVVSEETRIISVAEKGKLTRGLTRESLTSYLTRALVKDDSKDKTPFLKRI